MTSSDAPALRLKSTLRRLLRKKTTDERIIKPIPWTISVNFVLRDLA